MAGLPEVMEALRRADAAGNTEDARRLASIADSIRRQEAAQREAEAPGALESAGVGFAQGLMDVSGTVARVGDFAASQVTGESPTERILGQTPHEIMSGGNQEFRRRYGGAAGTTGRIAGQLATALPLMAGAGRVVQGAAKMAPAIAPAVNAASGAGGLGSKVIAGGVQGGTVAGLTSGASENPAMDVAAGTLFGGAVPAAGAAGRAVGRGVREAVRPSVSSASRALATRAGDLGIPLNAAQIADTPFLRTVDSVTRKVPFSGARPRLESQQAAFNRAVGRTIGVDTDKITPDVFSAAKARIGRSFEELTARNRLPITNEINSSLQRVKEDAARFGADDTARAVSAIVDDIAAKTDNGVLPGRAYQSIDSLIGRMSKTIGEKSHFLGQVRDVLRRGMDDAISDSDRAAWQTARQQWRNLKTIEPLVAKEATEGNIRPALLLGRVTADRAGKAAHATGRTGDLGELAQIGQRFLKDTVPSSGTSERLAILGAPAVGVVDPAAFAAAGGLVGASRGAQAFINSPAYKRFLLQRATGSVPGVGGRQGLLAQYAPPVLALPAVSAFR